MPPSGWPVPGVPGPALPPPSSLPPSWAAMQGPNDLGTACQADGERSRGLPYQLMVLSDGWAREGHRAQLMCCFQIVDASRCHRHCKKKKFCGRKNIVYTFDLKTTVNSAPDLTGLFETGVKRSNTCFCHKGVRLKETLFKQRQGVSKTLTEQPCWNVIAGKLQVYLVALKMIAFFQEEVLGQSGLKAYR